MRALIDYWSVRQNLRIRKSREQRPWNILLPTIHKHGEYLRILKAESGSSPSIYRRNNLMAHKSPRPGRSPGSPDVVLLNRRRMWSRLSRSQSVSFIWTSAARMSPPSVGLVLQGTEAPMWDTSSPPCSLTRLLTQVDPHTACACMHVMRAYQDVHGYIWTRCTHLRIMRVRSPSPRQNSLPNCRDCNILRCNLVRDYAIKRVTQNFLRFITLLYTICVLICISLLNEKDGRVNIPINPPINFGRV